MFFITDSGTQETSWLQLSSKASIVSIPDISQIADGLGNPKCGVAEASRKDFLIQRGTYGATRILWNFLPIPLVIYHLSEFGNARCMNHCQE